MRLSQSAAALVFLLFGTSAIAADLLPLKRGIYVRAGSACKGASNADTLSYWGERNGINDQRTRCVIKKLKRDGATYLIKRKCTSVRFGGSFHDEVSVTVRSRMSFVYKPWAAHRPPSSAFRYCGPKAQF